MAGCVDFAGLLGAAAEHRAELVGRLAAEGTDCWRMFHGAVEGLPGLAVDRYGELVLVALFRSFSAPAPVGALRDAVREQVGEAPAIALVDRRAGSAEFTVDVDRQRNEVVCHEAGMRCLVRARHRGQDPWLFLDLRAGRRAIRDLAAGRSVLNLFAYTATAGLAAAQAGAREVLNLDFAASALDVGRRNARLNGLEDRMRFRRADCVAALRQLAGTTVGRYGRRPPGEPFAPARFELVILDPPRLARSAFGAVDLVRDYQSVFKPAWLVTADGGVLLATNHVASVDRDAWVDVLRRCANKAGRPIRELELVTPDADFPSPDGRPPLKMALCQA